MNIPQALRPCPRRLCMTAIVMAVLSVPGSQAGAGTTSSHAASGTAVTVCNVSASSVAVTAKRSGGSFTTTFTPNGGTVSTPVTAYCNAPNGGKLTATTTSLTIGGSSPFQYTLAVSGWVTINLLSPSAATGTTTANAPTSSPSSGTVGLAANGLTSSMTNNTAYTATVTLSMTANP